MKTELKIKENLKYDIPAGVAVFFVAVPLCLGIAHASGAPLFAGLITGMIGGIVVGLMSNSKLSVSGPAAGLTAIAIAGITRLGSFDAFLTATLIAGLIQVVLGVMRTGSVATYIPNTVIKGMLSAIGLILIIKQFPHMIGYDIEEMGVEEFAITHEDINEAYQENKDAEQNTFTVFLHSLAYINKGVMGIGLTGLFLMFAWDKLMTRKYKVIPASLVVVLVGVLMNWIYDHVLLAYPLMSDHFVNIPPVRSLFAFTEATSFPDFSILMNPAVYTTGLTIAIVASIETLLSTEAIDKIDPKRNRTDKNRELIAQGIGNTLCGLLGGLPMTAVIVRGSVNVSAGARSKVSTITHGILICVAVMFLASVMNRIPLASLAAILIYTGYKLLSPRVLVEQYKKGWAQLIPFVVTLGAIVLTDLLIGVLIGIVVSMIYIVMEDYKGTILRVIDHGVRKRIVLGENINFLHKPKLVRIFDSVPAGSVVEIDASRNFYTDRDIIEIIEDFERSAGERNIEVILGGIKNMDNHREQLHHNMQESYDRLFANNKKWVNEKLSQDPEYFKSLAKGQTPQYLFIGCSDSRVPANEITGTEPGEMFVQRNIANMVVHSDVNLMSVVQYSVEVLNVKHVIVCGHYGCGGVKASTEEVSHGLIDKWLRNIKDVYRLHKQELDGIKDEEKRHRRLVELNVREQVYNLMKTSFIQKNRKLYGFPEVHGWVYDIEDGHLIDMKVHIEKDFPEFDSVYRIF